MVKRRNRNKYQLLTWFFVASLLLNVQSVFSCTMMSDMSGMQEPVHECCLTREDSKDTQILDSAGMFADTCFTQITSLQIKASPEADADPSNDHVLVKDKQGLLDLTPAIALLIFSILRVPQASKSFVSTNGGYLHTPLPVYQATRRYRI